MKKKVMLLSIALMLVLTGVVSAASIWGKYKGYDIIRITVDGKEVKTDVPAFVFNNRTMVPVYLLKEAGISYSADGKTQTVDIKKPKPTTTTSYTFDPTAETKRIIALGGAGVTIMNIDGDTTAMVYYEQNINFDADWPNIDDVFKSLIKFNSTFSRVEYGVNGVTQGIIEIRTKNYKDFINGVITEAQLQEQWLLTGSMFTGSSSTGGNTGGSTGETTTTTIVSKIDGEFEGFEEGTLFELANGQIWKQISYDYKYSYKYSPKVVIYKDGVYWYMQVDGVDKTVKVERIK